MTIAGENPYLVTADDPEDARKALAIVEAWLEPAPMADLVAEIGELYLVGHRRREDSADRVALIKLYARELSKFPADLTIGALRAYRGEFFPALDAIRVPIETDPRYLGRRARAKALRAFLIDGPDPEPRSIPPEEKAAVAAGFERLRANLRAGDAAPAGKRKRRTA